jgi:Fic family protein
MKDYRHLKFCKHWELTQKCVYQLGQCDAFVKAISNIPLKPENRDRLLQVSLIKGAQATTAIEGNTLSEDEIEKIQEGWSLPPSKEYQEIEVKNIINAFNLLLKEIIIDNNIKIITSDLIKNFHQMISKGLGDHIDAIPGRLRMDNRHVGSYRPPDYKNVPGLLDKLCNWVRKEFHFDHNKEQSFATSVVQAIVTHVYIEWIHPFGDGNGRTGRLIEFYILLRAGLPSIVSHILSNFYNQTRPEYYRQFDKAKRKQDLTQFIEYAVQGFRDGLSENLRIIQEDHFIIFWHNYIYEKFANTAYTKKGAFKRKRDLILQLPVVKEYSVDEIVLLTPLIAKRYSSLKMPTVRRDLKDLQSMNLIKKKGQKYRANIEILSKRS